MQNVQCQRVNLSARANRARGGYLVRRLRTLVPCLLCCAVIGCATNSGGGGNGPNPPGGNDSPDGPGGDPDAFALVADIDPHARALYERLEAEGADVVAWAGETLLPEDYAGAMRAPGGVIAGLSGGAFDRCVAVRHLLSASGIESRYALTDTTCAVEAMIDGEVVRVATSRFDNDSIPDAAERTTAIPEATQHRIEFVEAIYPQGAGEPSERVIFEGRLSEVSAMPITVEYANDGDDDRLRLRVGQDGADEQTTVFGEPVGSARRQDLVIRHLRPDGAVVTHRRILFDSNSTSGNRTPDAETDQYAIWIGAHATGPLFHQFERESLTAPNSTANRLRMRAIELAVETDHAAWRVFENNDEAGTVRFDDLRIIIAAREKRDAASDALTPSLDLLANPRRIVGNDDPIAVQVALGMSDAMVEGVVLERATGMHALSVPNIFAALFQEQANDETSRLALYDDALSRLELEGVTGEALILHDASSGGSVRVVRSSGDLVLERSEEEIAALQSLAGDAFAELTTTTDGLVLPSGADRGWVIDLLLLDQGAAIDFTPTIEHVESPQLGLATPSGSAIFGKGDYRGAGLDIHAVARSFESLDDPADPDSRMDRADWHVAGDTGAIAGSGSMEFATPGADADNPRLMQWGADRDNFSFYENPLWVAPEIAASIRSNDSFTMRMIYEEDGSSTSSHSVFFNKFSEGTLPIEIDGVSHAIPTITARDQLGDHRITIARDGLTRLVLTTRSPPGDATLTAINTPQQLRLRGRIMSHRGSEAVREAGAYAVGVADAELSIDGVIGRSWPDGSVDIRMPETRNPTLPASVAVLTDTSGSMGEPADSGCTGEACPLKIDVVAESLATIVGETSESVELALWGFPSSFDGECEESLDQIAAWSLDREETVESLGLLTAARLTGGTPLSGAVRAAIGEMKAASVGVAKRLIVLADGDNDCTDDLTEIEIPKGLVIHTVGIGVSAGGDAETQLADLAERSGGTYTRTSGADALSDALLSLGTLPVPVVTAPTTLSTAISAEHHEAVEFDFAVDTDDVLIYLNEQPGRAPIAGFTAVLPGEPMPTLDDSVPADAIELIESHRDANENLIVIMPDRAVDVGLFRNAFGWYEIDQSTGHTTAVGPDGLHVAVAAVGLGGKVAGLWSGVTSVMGSFAECAVPSCGDDVDEIVQSICGSIQGDASTWSAIYQSFIGSILPGVDGAILAQSFQNGATLVETACAGGIDSANYTAGTGANISGGAVSQVFGGSIGWGYSTMLGLILNPGIVTDEG